jgi:hypothetical protein
MIALCVRVARVGGAYTAHIFQKRLVLERRPPQSSPVLPLTTGNHVVNGGKSQALVVEMTVQHGQAKHSLILIT